jgi:hypothetical protein
MEPRTKRTYRISARSQARVRELTTRYGVASSQDGVVEVAVDRLYREVEAETETARWSEAADDREFRDEVSALARTFERAEAWPD